MNAQIVLENIGVRFPSRVLFSGVNWTLYEGMRVALAGRNGSGKSTLLKIMAGGSESSEGTFTHVGGTRLRIGFLDQSLLDSSVVAFRDEKDEGVSAVSYLVHKLELAHTHDDFPEDREWEVRKILSGLGFSEELMDGPMSVLSGGWLLRVFIALALLNKPNVLLLDEPTNHLDISSIQWLEEFLTREYKGSLVLVTHDVALQKRTTDSLAILHGGRFYFQTHRNDYLSFRESLGTEKEILARSIEAVEKKIEENMDFVERFRAKAQTAARAQSKLRAAEKFMEEKAELKDRLQRLEGFSYNLRFRFRSSEAGSRFPLSLKGLGFRYSEDGDWILRNVTMDVKRGQRIAIMGDNGAGKTTLLNVVAERLKAVEGEVQKGAGIQEGYFGQHQLDELHLESTVLDNLKTKATGVSLEQLRGWLGAFGFGGDEAIVKKAKVLSGGERARLALLRILVSPINFVLLDEPTNHLDVETKELLKEAIRDFDGTVLLVSHDRDFISGVADRILYLTTDHKLIDHLGDLGSFFDKYPQYVRHLDGKTRAAPVVAATPKISAGPTLSFEERKKVKNQIKSLERKIAAVEAEMATLGAEKDGIQARMDPSEAARLGEIENLLHNRMIDWEKWSTELEGLRAKFDPN